MWVNKRMFEQLLSDLANHRESLSFERTGSSRMSALATALREQKAKDDITIDWMRHRVNALEKMNASLLLRAGVHVPIPEIVPSRPGSISELSELYNAMPSFEDVGDAKAATLGIGHTSDGQIDYLQDQ